jgi:miniconductance mechanosensitive channel
MVNKLYIEPDRLDSLIGSYVSEPWMQTIAAVLVMLVLATLANWVAKHIVLRLFVRLMTQTPFILERTQLGSIAARLSNIVPALVIQAGIGTIPNLPDGVSTLVYNLGSAFIILTLSIALSGALGLINVIHQRRPDAANRPIKGYVQVAKLVVYGAAAILVIAALMDRSPLLLLSGLGAMAAVLMLVFKDTILSLVASVQIGSNDMVRVGDWIEMPQLNADGDVIDIALHTVKIQNFDKTITTIPTHRLITESFKNWRGMSESGGRRIMRSIMIDQNSVNFLKSGGKTELLKLDVLRPYLLRKEDELAHCNDAKDDGSVEDVNRRRLTNLGTFRAYVIAYLHNRKDISAEKTLIVRQLAPSSDGLPLEIYAFTETIVWSEYEDIQADIFDHLLAILPAFGLRLFQSPTGLDFMASLYSGHECQHRPAETRDARQTESAS